MPEIIGHSGVLLLCKWWWSGQHPVIEMHQEKRLELWRYEFIFSLRCVYLSSHFEDISAAFLLKTLIV